MIYDTIATMSSALSDVRSSLKPADLSHIPFAETKLDGIRFRYALVGQGPPVVFLHGFTLDARMWTPQLQAFSKRHQVLIYDQRGYGGSTALSPDAPRRTHGEDLGALLDHLGLPRVALIGSSMGGRTALEFALRHPERVSELVLVSSHVEGWRPSRQMAKIFQDVRTAMARSGPHAAKQAWAASSFFRLALRGEHGALLRRMLEESDADHWRKPPPAKSSTMIGRLHHIEVPTLVMVGEIEVEDFHQIADTLSQSLPNARLHELSRVGHLPNLEAPDTFNAVALNFLAGKDRAAQRPRKRAFGPPFAPELRRARAWA